MQRKYLFGVLGATAIVVLALTVLAATPVTASPGKDKGKQKIHWDPPKVSATVQRGVPFVTTVTFTPTVDISNAVVRFSSSLSGTIQANPDSFPALVAGTPYQVELTFTAPTDEDRMRHNGVMALKTETKQYAKPLKLRLSIEPEE